MLPATSLPRVLWQYVASWLQGDKAIIRLRATCRWLRRIEIHQLPKHMERRLTAKRLQSVKSIRRLGIYGCMNVTNEMIKSCIQLEWLSVYDTNVTWFPSTLRHLDIYKREDVNNEMIQSCTRLEWLDASYTKITWFPRTLRYLDIYGCKVVMNEMLQNAFQTETSHLEWLDASWTNVTWFPSTLRHLYIRNRTDITVEMLAHLKNCEITR